jgi:thiamine pyrophosphate-dependent acetolactate synthase large subunit-like protein
MEFGGRQVKRIKKAEVDRRGFLKAAAAGVLATVSPAPGTAQNPQPARGTTTPPLSKAAETQAPPDVEILTTDRPGSDFMVDIVKSLGFEYVCANPGSSFRALHESLVNYGGNKSPELITCCHEESSVAMGHGYAKVEGKPLAAMLHGPVGLQHASMAIYNAYCDRVPVFLIVGNALDATMRRPGIEWVHSGQDLAAMVRDFTKWDDTPISLEHFAESAVRGYKIAMTPPMMPVLLIADGDLQERPVEANAALHVPKLPVLSYPQAESGAIAEVAKLLVAAENPVLVADRAARTSAGMALLVELAETLQAPVIDQWGRLNFPTQHPLNHSDRSASMIASADVILGLELTDFWGTVHSYRDQLQRTSSSITRPGAKLISISAGDLYAKGNYQDLQRYPEVDLAIEADAEASLPSLIEAVKRSLTDDRKRAFADRGAKLAQGRRQLLDAAREQATFGWDSSPISTARVAAELWAQVKNEDWALVSETAFFSNWPLKLWDFSKHYQYIGSQGGFGVGYGAPAAIGAALAHRKHGRLAINIQNDGDFMYAPGVFWTAAHHRIPLLSVMHNNRAYHQEVMHVQRMANRHQRGITHASVGTTLQDPNLDFAKLAAGMGVYAEGPIENPADLGPALQRAIAVVKRGEPALIDVVTQPR